MKLKILFTKILLLVCILSSSFTCFAYSFMVDGLAYNTSGNTATVTYTERSTNNYSSLTGIVTIPSTVSYNGVTYTVTAIDSWAFYDCSYVTGVNIPNTVTTIEPAAFKDCTGLTSVSIPNSVTTIGDFEPRINWYYYGAFEGCRSLTQVTIGSGLTSLGDATFMSCTSLKSLNLPNCVTKIGNCTFQNCYGLTGNFTIPNSCTSIGGSAFSGCSGLTGVNITNLDSWCNINFANESSNPLYTAKYLYLNGTEVKNLVIPGSINIIRSYSFYNCKSLSSVTIPNTVTTIGDYAFYNCI